MLCAAADRTRKTRKPSRASVRGVSPVAMQSRKCLVSMLSGSASSSSIISPSAFTGFGTPSTQSMRCRYRASFDAHGSPSSKTAMASSPTTTKRCSLNGCSHETKMLARAPLGNRRSVVVTSATAGLRYAPPVDVTRSGSSPTSANVIEMSCGAKLHRMSSSRRIFPRLSRVDEMNWSGPNSSSATSCASLTKAG